MAAVILILDGQKAWRLFFVCPFYFKDVTFASIIISVRWPPESSNKHSRKVNGKSAVVIPANKTKLDV